MLLITCPICGATGDETDFHAGGEAHVKRPASQDPENVSDQDHHDYLYKRENEKGLTHELWHCSRGCGKWFHAARDTVTLDFKATYKISDPIPSIPDES